MTSLSSAALMSRIAILGASGHGKVVADAASCAGWKEVRFFDDDMSTDGTVAGLWPIVGTSADLFSQIQEFDGVIVAIGNCELRHRRHRDLQDRGAQLVSVVHPKGWISTNARLGAGGVMMAGSVINIGASLGEACIVNTGATVDHDCEVGEAVHVAPGAHLSGNVVIGARSWIGVGASVKQGVRIGADVIVGAGAVVTKDVESGLTVFGVPASARR